MNRCASILVFGAVLIGGCGGGSSERDVAVGAAGSTVKALAAAATANISAASGTAPPIVFNWTGTARAGEVVSLQGDNFGDAPVVALDAAPDRPLQIVNRNTTGWLAVRLPDPGPAALQLRVRNATGTSALVRLNGARPLHLDALELVPGGSFRIVGRNLRVAGSTPRVLVNGIEATIDLDRSDEHLLTATVPKTLAASRAATVTVDNGNGTGAATLDRTIAVLRATGSDPFATGLSWAAGFLPVAARVVDAASDARISDPAVCNGSHDDTAGLQRAVELASADGGGIVQLPAGRCILNDWLPLRSRVVVQGKSRRDTEIVYSVNYPIFGVGLDWVGLRSLTLRNAGPAGEGPLIKDSTHVLIQDVALRIGTSRQMYFSGNRHFAVLGSEIVQEGSIDRQGPYTFSDTAGLAFEGNTTRWVNGAPTFERIHDGVVVGSRFSRDTARSSDAGTVHSMTLDFAHRVAVIGNTFDVIGGPITDKSRNDGETILVEGGSSARTESLGSVANATATTLTDRSNTLSVDPFGSGAIPENYGIAIVAGKGAGQTRRVVAYSAPTVTVDRAWDVLPDATSRYASFVWGLDKALIKNNVLSQNPRGIWLYGTSVRDVDIVGNRIDNGGGIYLRTTQKLADKRFTIAYGVRIAGNRVANTTADWMSYINSVFVNIDARSFGIATIGVEIRDNDLVANRPNVQSRTEEYANLEGLMTMMRVESFDPYESSPVPRLLGTVIAGNACTHCDVAVRLGTGAGGTTLVDNRLVDTPSLLDDMATAGTSERSIETVVLP